MNLFGFFKKQNKINKRSFTESLLGASLFSTDLGSVTIDENSVMGIPAFSRGAQVISKAVASMPLHLYKKEGVGRYKVEDSEFIKIFRGKANPFMTAETLIQTCQLHLLVHGNAYIKVVRTQGGRVSELYPIHPSFISIEVKDFEVEYTYTNGGETEVLQPGSLIHIKGHSLDGITGLSLIDSFQKSLGIMIAAETYGVNVFENSASTNLFITMPPDFSGVTPEQLDVIRKNFHTHQTGARNAGKAALLPPGLDIKPVKVTAEELQLLQTRQYHVTEVSRMLNIQPHLVGDLSRSTFSNIEHQSIEFLQYTLNPWLVAWEQALTAYLLPEGSEGFFFEFNRDSLLRTDTKARYEAHAIALQNGILNIDEVRAIESLNPLPEDQGQVHLVPMNLHTPAQAKDENRRLVDLEEVRKACIKTTLSKCKKVVSNILDRAKTDEEIVEGVRKFLSTHKKYCERTMEPYNSLAEKPMSGEEVYKLVEPHLQKILQAPELRSNLKKFIEL